MAGRKENVYQQMPWECLQELAMAAKRLRDLLSRLEGICQGAIAADSEYYDHHRMDVISGYGPVLRDHVTDVIERHQAATVSHRRDSRGTKKKS